MFRAGLLAIVFAVSATQLAAQGTEIAFGGLAHDSSLPVEVSADSLKVDQSDGSAIFDGNVLVAQGEMRLSANKVRVKYLTDQTDATGQIETMEATGDVTLVNGAEAAEGQTAVYSVAGGTVVMTGDVILTQGRNAISGEKLSVDLAQGTGVMEGRVRTVFQTQDN